MFSFFKKKKQEPEQEIIPLRVDMHSHVLPGIDDGAANMEESLSMIKGFVEMGYQKLIMTPHIMEDYYRNTPEIILSKLDEVRKATAEAGLSIELEAAAEYYLDEFMMARIEREEPLLTFGDKYVLVETSYMNACPFLSNAVYQLRLQGYKPVLAHPERYVYLFEDWGEAVRMKEEYGLIFQVNLNSLTGYYSKDSMILADKFIQHGMVTFFGSDCHKARHQDVMRNALRTRAYAKAMEQGIANNWLLQSQIA